MHIRAVAHIGLTEAIAIARSVALRSGQKIDSNQEVVGQGLSNLVGSFLSGYPLSGSFTRCGLNYDAGAKTPLAAVFASVFLMIILALIARWITYLSMAAMAGVLFLVAWGLIDRKEIAAIFRGPRHEQVVLLVTFVATRWWCTNLNANPIPGQHMHAVGKIGVAAAVHQDWRAGIGAGVLAPAGEATQPVG